MTESNGIGRNHAEPAGNGWPLTAIVLVVTVAGYLLLLGWHHLQEYQTGKVWALIGVLAALAAWYGWRGQSLVGALTQALVLTVMWSVDATSDSTGGGDGMWLAGAIFVFVGTFVGAASVAVVAAAVATRRSTKRRNGETRARS